LLPKYLRRPSCPLLALCRRSSLVQERLPAQSRDTLKHRESLRLRGRKSNKSAAETSDERTWMSRASIESQPIASVAM
jgi:hypothetical protein